MRGAALVMLGRASEALAILAPLGSEQYLSAEPLAALEASWQAAALRQSAHANDLHQRWNQLPARLRECEEVLLAYALRAGELADSGLVARQIGQARWAPFAHPDYLARAPALRTPKDLTQHATLCFSPLARISAGKPASSRRLARLPTACRRPLARIAARLICASTPGNTWEQRMMLVPCWRRRSTS